MLNKNPKSRIGAVNKNEIKQHPFFRGLDWAKMYNREIQPPVHLRMDTEDYVGAGTGGD